jgi:endonuclease YncB( thermonuclease family)
MPSLLAQSLPARLASAVLAFGLFPTITALAEPISASRVRIVDGDTIRIDGQPPDIQLMGFDAPEIRGAKCDAEIDLGVKAARRLRALLREGSLDFSSVSCPCPPKSEGTAYCRRGRRCGVLKINGRNVGEILIAEKLALPSDSASAQSWCRR